MRTTHHGLARKAPASTCPVRRRRLGRGLYAPELLEARIAPATFIVTSLLDNGDGPNTTLREAVGAANLLIGADTIVFKLAAPTTAGTIVLNGTEILISDALTIKGPGVDLLALSGNDLSRIFKIDYTTTSLAPTTISGLTLTDGKSANSGGALYSAEPLTLKNVVIRSSEAGSTGGAVAVDTTGKVSVIGSRIVHNKSTSFGGGFDITAEAGVSFVKTTIANNTGGSYAGLYAEANGPKAVILVDTCIIANNIATAGIGGMGFENAVDGKIIIKNSLITGNQAGNGDAGGLFIDGGNLVVTNTTFSNNSANNGGAIVTASTKSVTISGSRFLGNNATAASGGGAVYLNGGDMVKVTGSLFAGNTSSGDGGAITVDDGVTLAVAGSSFLGNTAALGGGALAVGDGSVLTMKSSILSGNSAGDGGGAIFGFNGAVLNLTGNKFTENRATGGGGALYLIANATASTANLSGNLFQANVAGTIGGAVRAVESSIFSSKGDKFIGNVAASGQGGGVHLVNTGGILITGSLFQSNVAGSSGGGLGIGASATLSGLKVFDNIAGPGGLGGGLRISGGTVMILKSIITGNIANEEGGGILFNAGTTTIDAASKVFGNVARTEPNIGTL